jgi:pilus assembly protein CpaB
MNKRFLSVLVFAVVVAGGFSLFVYRFVDSRIRASQPKQIETRQVLVASRNLEIGTLIKDSDVSSTEWPGEIPQHAIQDKKDILERGVVAPIYKGEPVLETRLAPKGAGGGLAAIIPVGMRVVSVRVNDISGVAGFVTPGQRVDVLISGNPPAAPPTLGTVSRTLLQNIQVLSAGQNIQKDAEGKPVSVPVVNLLVSPEQAEVISLANSETRIQLVLRNPLDTEIAKTPGTAVRNLFSGQKGLGLPTERASRPAVTAAVKPPPAKRPAVVVEVIQGNARTQKEFQEEPED